MKTLVMMTLAGALLAGPALAQMTEFYIVQDTTSKKCTIVDKKPTVTSTTVIVGDGKVYKTRTEADSAMSTEKICVTK
jgi:hypothetical protein